MEYYAGLDVSLRFCAICIADNKGKVIFERELACEVADISDCLQQLPYPIERVGFEAGTMSQHLFFGLQAMGFDVVCMAAAQREARDKARLSTANPTHACSGAIRASNRLRREA